jgi:hypothetical protein
LQALGNAQRRFHELHGGGWFIAGVDGIEEKREPAGEVLGFDVAERAVRFLNVAPIRLGSEHQAGPERRHLCQMRVPASSQFAGEDRTEQRVLVDTSVECVDQLPDIGFVGFHGADEWHRLGVWLDHGFSRGVN